MSAPVLADGRFRVERQLGEGGMATVYLARDEELGRLVAVKVLADHLAHDEDVRERFVREARHAAQLSHPNVVGVFDVGEEDGRPFIVMEYVEGETVADVVRRGALTPDEAVRIALEACAALEHAHAAGVVHRDVKPANLLLRSDGTVKIADFGIAHATSATSLTEAGTVLGTAAYLAPEQARGERVTPATDVYSLGTVLYELLAGRPPHSFDSLARLAHGPDRDPPTPLRDLAPSVPAALEDVVMRALARKPEHRPQTAAELARELETALDGGAPEAATQILATTPGRASRAVPRWALPALAALIAAVVLAVALADSEDDAPERVPPVEQAADPAERARNLAEWLRAHSSDEP